MSFRKFMHRLRPRSESPRRLIRRAVFSSLVVVLVSMVTASDTSAQRQASPRRGLASWYGPKFHGRLTASGQRFDQSKLTAASRTLPLGTKLLVHAPHSRRCVIVRVNDRGPHVGGRVLDLSRAAAQQLDMMRQGIALVEFYVLNRDSDVQKYCPTGTTCHHCGPLFLTG